MAQSCEFGCSAGYVCDGRNTCVPSCTQHADCSYDYFCSPEGYCVRGAGFQGLLEKPCPTKDFCNVCCIVDVFYLIRYVDAFNDGTVDTNCGTPVFDFIRHIDNFNKGDALC